jgi:hypothetical protein
LKHYRRWHGVTKHFRSVPPAKSFVRLAASIGLSAMIGAPAQNCAAAVIRITDDRGGNIGAYWSRYSALRASDDQVVIDGMCSSACTLVLGIVPPNRICVTKNAMLGFHAAWQPGFLGVPVANEPATRTLMSLYPIPIRQWIARNGGLGDRMIYLSGRDLTRLYRECQ